MKINRSSRLRVSLPGVNLFQPHGHGEHSIVFSIALGQVPQLIIWYVRRGLVLEVPKFELFRDHQNLLRCMFVRCDTENKKTMFDGYRFVGRDAKKDRAPRWRSFDVFFSSHNRATKLRVFVLHFGRVHVSLFFGRNFVAGFGNKMHRKRKCWSRKGGFNWTKKSMVTQHTLEDKVHQEGKE